MKTKNKIIDSDNQFNSINNPKVLKFKIVIITCVSCKDIHEVNIKGEYICPNCGYKNVCK